MNYIKHLRRYFIPGKHNQYKPHFFRLEAVLATAGVIVFFFLAAVSLDSLVIRSGSSQLGAVVSSVLVELTNTDRTANKLHGLIVSPVLQQAAQLKANDMAAKSYFAHNSPEGLTPWHWFEEAGYGFSFAGENLAVYFSDSAELEHAWMNSPLHRANILNSYFTEIGIATAKGVYQGRETVYVVQEFGRPSRRIASVAAKANIVPTKNISVSTTTNKVALAEIKKEVPVVKGAATEAKPFEIAVKEDTFIAVKSEDGANVEVVTEEKMAVPTLAFAGTSAPTILKIAASPQTLLRTVYSFLAILITFALMLMVGIEIKRQHPLHIFYGVSLLAFMGVLLFSWQGFFFGKLLVL
jgi:uncharacterized protein YkwD